MKFNMSETRFTRQEKSAGKFFVFRRGGGKFRKSTPEIHGKEFVV
jgi:hypothetical protein